MKYNKSSLLTAGLGLIVLTVVTVSAYVGADSFSGTSYKIDASVNGSFSGQTVSPSYSLISSGGESIIGNGLGGSYLLSQGYVAQLDKSLQVNTQPSGLVAHYPLDESVPGTAWDMSANSNTATDRVAAKPAITTGKINNGLLFTPSSGVPRIETATPVLSTTSNFSIEAWVNPGASFASGGAIAAQNNSNSSTIDKWTLSLSSTYSANILLTKGSTGTSTSIDGVTPFAPSTWNHAVVTYDGTLLKLYINGILDSQVDLTPSGNNGSYTFPAPLSIGARGRPIGSFALTGSVDEVKVFNRTLTDNDVLAEYTAQNSGYGSGLYTGPVTPGASQLVDSDVITQTDAPGYSLTISQNSDLTSGAYTIPGISSGTIAAPVLWSEGTTKGLGFTLTSGPSLDPKWGATPNFKYAALPGSPTPFYTKTGYTAGSKDSMGLRYRLDTDTSQTAGEYTNRVTITGTMTP